MTEFFGWDVLFLLNLFAGLIMFQVGRLYERKQNKMSSEEMLLLRAHRIKKMADSMSGIPRVLRGYHPDTATAKYLREGDWKEKKCDPK